MKTTVPFLCLFFLLVGCNSPSEKSVHVSFPEVQNNKIPNPEPKFALEKSYIVQSNIELPETFYKRFESIQEQNMVVLDLYRNKNSIGGFLYIDTILYPLRISDKSKIDSNRVKLLVYSSYRDGCPMFGSSDLDDIERLIYIIAGTFTSQDKMALLFSNNLNITNQINFVEDYSKGSYQFDIYHKRVEVINVIDSAISYGDYILEFPEITDTQYTQPVQFIDHILDSIIFNGFKDVDSKMDGFVKWYEENKVDYGILLDERYSILWNINDILILEKFNLSGGIMHPIESYQYFVLDIKQRRILSLDDLFLDNFQPAFEKMILEKYGYFDDDNKGWYIPYVGFGDGSLTRNFYISKAGVIFVYYPGEISAYSAGTFRFFLSWEEVSDYIKDPNIIDRISLI